LTKALVLITNHSTEIDYFRDKEQA